jgi:hypothetical protein
MVTFNSKIEIVSLQREEIALINLIRQVGYGSVEIVVKNGVPVIAKEIIKSIQL